MERRQSLELFHGAQRRSSSEEIGDLCEMQLLKEAK